MATHLQRARGFGAQRMGITDVVCLCGTPARLEILIALADAAFEVGALAETLGRDITHVSHQLRPLREAGLVKNARRGSRLVYSLNVAAVETEEAAGVLSLTVRAADGSSVCFTVCRGAMHEVIAPH